MYLRKKRFCLPCIINNYIGFYYFLQSFDCPFTILEDISEEDNDSIPYIDEDDSKNII